MHLWKCPQCGKEGTVIPSINVRCECGHLSTSPGVIAPRIIKPFEPLEKRLARRPPIDFSSLPKEIDEHF